MKIYLAGPMTGVSNYAAKFAFAATKLRAIGFDVFSPAEKEAEIDHTGDEYDLAFRRACFAIDTKYICEEADAVYFLPDWYLSKGARAEYYLAKAIGIPTVELSQEYVYGHV